MLEFENISYILLVIMSSLAAICSIWTLAIIYGMKKWNNYLKIITNLTVCQTVYDLSLVVVPCPNCSLFAITFFRCYAGVATALWTNTIMLLVYYIVKTTKSFPFDALYLKVFAVINIFSFVLGLIIAYSFQHDPASSTFNNSSFLYYWIRIVSIIANIIIYAYLQYVLRKRVNVNMNISKDPVRELANRMKYYPVAQIVCRGAASWYEMQYGYTTFSYIETAALSYRAADIIYVLTLPTAGILFFFIFLANAPGAFQYITRGFISCMPCFFADSSSTLQDETLLQLGTNSIQFKMRKTNSDLAQLSESELEALINKIHEDGREIGLSPCSSTNPSFVSQESGISEQFRYHNSITTKASADDRSDNSNFSRNSHVSILSKFSSTSRTDTSTVNSDS